MKVDGHRVREARRATLVDGRPMSRAQLAVKVNVSVDTIERIEQNRPGDVAATTIYAISRELDVSLESLFTEEPVA